MVAAVALRRAAQHLAAHLQAGGRGGGEGPGELVAGLAGGRPPVAFQRLAVHLVQARAGVQAVRVDRHVARRHAGQPRHEPARLTLEGRRVVREAHVAVRPEQLHPAAEFLRELGQQRLERVADVALPDVAGGGPVGARVVRRERDEPVGDSRAEAAEAGGGHGSG